MNIFYLPNSGRGEKCDDRKEEPFRMTGRAEGANKVHFCTRSENHGGRHRDDVSGEEW